MEDMTRRRTPRPTRSFAYPRTARLDRLIAQIVAEELERIDDPRLYLATVTGVSTDSETTQATVWFGSLTHEGRMALTELRTRLQSAVARQTHLKNTPRLSFATDPAIETGTRVEEILRDLRDQGEFDEQPESKATDSAGSESLATESPASDAADEPS